MSAPRLPLALLLLGVLAGCVSETPQPASKQEAFREAFTPPEKKYGWSGYQLAVAPVVRYRSGDRDPDRERAVFVPYELDYLSGRLAAPPQGPPDDELPDDEPADDELPAGGDVAPLASAAIAGVGSAGVAAVGSGSALDLLRLDLAEAREATGIANVGSAQPWELLTTDERADVWKLPPFKEQRYLQRRLVDLVQRSLYTREGKVTRDVLALDVQDVEPGRVGADPVTNRHLARQALCRAADDAGAELVLHVELTYGHVAFLERDLPFWLTNLVAVWAWGAVPAVLIPDELFEVHLEAAVTVQDSRTGVLLLSEAVGARFEHALNDHQRGWTLPGLVGLEPFFLEGDDYQDAYETLVRHAVEQLSGEVAALLRQRLPKELDTDLKRRLLREGDPATPRTHALFIGNDHAAGADNASNDARELSELLRGSGTLVSDKHFKLLEERDSGQEVRRSDVLRELARIARRARSHDTLLIYYSGPGCFDAEAGAQLELGEEEKLSLGELADAVRAAFMPGHAPRVQFVLDTAFAPVEPNAHAVASRSRGDPEVDPGPDPVTYLEPVANANAGWTVLAAAGASEGAYELKTDTGTHAHGFFTLALLAALAGHADTDGDGAVTPKEASEFIGRRVADSVQLITGAPQHPVWKGSTDDVPLARCVQGETK